MYAIQNNMMNLNKEHIKAERLCVEDTTIYNNKSMKDLVLSDTDDLLNSRTILIFKNKEEREFMERIKGERQYE